MPGKSLVAVMAAGMAPSIKAQTLSAVPSTGWWFRILESFGGAWQSNIEVDSGSNLLQSPAVFACVTCIQNDIAKMRVRLMKRGANRIWTEPDTLPAAVAPFVKVLHKPNRYQNHIEFVGAWIASKLLWGNTYVLKGRNSRGVVEALYILSPQLVKPLVAEDGGVYYELARDNLSGLSEPITIPAREIIHDKLNPLWHPLVGVSPLYAAAAAATTGNRIQANSRTFFANMSRPSGVLLAPGQISDETAHRLKDYWDTNFSGGNLGKIAVLGDNLKYEAMSMPADQAQLIEQLRMTVEDIARTFHVPLYKIGGPVPPQTSIEALQQSYYSDALQIMVECLEVALDEGLELPDGYRTELDLDGLLRMDTAARYEASGKAVGAGWLKPNEARAKEGLEPVPGGDTCYLQQQYWGLDHLANRTAAPDGIGIPAAPSAKAEDRSRSDVTLVCNGDVSIPVDAMTEQLREALASGFDRLDNTLHQPVVPKYDEKGILIEGRRVPGASKIERSATASMEARIAALEQRVPLGYAGAWVDGQQSNAGWFFTHAGSLWYCRETTRDRPGTSNAFQLAVKKGRDSSR